MSTESERNSFSTIHYREFRGQLVKTVRLCVTAGSILWYCGCVLSQIFIYADSLSASVLWKFTILGCVLSWMLFVLNVMASRRLRSLSINGLIIVFSILAIGLLVTMTVAPLLGYWAFAQKYDIVYFDRFGFAFPSGMILLLSTTPLVIAFNIRLSIGHRADPGTLIRRSEYGLGLAAQNVAVYSSIVLWGNLIQTYALHSSNQYVAFSILMILIMLIPVLQPTLSRLTILAKRQLAVGGITTTISLVALLKFVFDLPTWPPSLGFAAFAFLLVAISSALGYLGALGIDLRSLRYELTRSLLTLSVDSVLSILLVYATWFYSHAHIAVTLFENITVG